MTGLDLDAIDSRWSCRSDGDALDVNRLIARVRELEKAEAELAALKAIFNAPCVTEDDSIQDPEPFV